MWRAYSKWKGCYLPKQHKSLTVLVLMMSSTEIEFFMIVMIANMEDGTLGTVVLTSCSPIITNKITYFMR